VILTGRADDRRRANELGASGYLTKPVELVELLATVQGAGRDARPEP
jgi:DNA-binding response OmpR family regulator